MTSPWLGWIQQLQGIAQTGLNYKNHPFDVARYEQVHQIAVAMLAAQAEADPATIADLLRQDVGHATPKVEVRGAVFRDGKILLVQESSDGLWALPGGWADIGDSPSQAIEREIFEESGYQAKATQLLAVYDRANPLHGHPPAPFHSYKLFFRCEITGGQPTPSYETTTMSFFGPDDQPPLSPGRTSLGQLQHCFACLNDPTLLPHFD
ncbi:MULTISPECIES: NUDIX hydrolase [Cyanophyceae]|uniref:NUDIX hydrolase n=1 Tax=Cyanophyceae TaxID=3028117 RepID=UPI0016895267|nr:MULTISPECIES: NUDIX hydrolase [Cyanophyceae]MBD1917770.1 NUDIX hydrolase [Phormidium sp. FACHB-77]MBD2032889.1 NUDIX hydrolase [Phormidium sp. FACHB-322]MBD2051636.1 NUDIX hydrolase [Leptolyngbya sp. FACHB-60]